ncbi:MAG: hypothetical protein H3C51_00625 [Rubellimicrobium sp.]|nr:hypothetical protein [Rubellimicrobium sp.]
MRRADTRRAGGTGLLVALAGFVLALALGLGLQALMQARLDRALAPDQAALLDTAANVAEQSLGRALAHDLPVAQLPGIEAWLETMRGNLGTDARIELELEGQTFSAGVAQAGDVARTRTLDPPGIDARLVFHLPRHAVPDGVAGSLWYPALVALAAALLGWVVFRLGAGRALVRSRARLEQRLALLDTGAFAADAPDTARAYGRMPADAALHALALRLEPVNLRHALLLQHAEGLRGIDFDGSLGAQVDEVLADLPGTWRDTTAVRR